MSNDRLWSVDYHRDSNSLTGWYASALSSGENNIVTIFPLKGGSHSSKSTLYRPDILEKKLNKSPNCGFDFRQTNLFVNSGDMGIVRFKSRMEHIEASYICGDKVGISSEFDRLEIPRSDNSIMDPSTSDIVASGSDLLNFKRLMIRLRRHKRGRSWRSRFVGINYKWFDSDWLMFNQIINDYAVPISSTLSSRYIWSICDTFVDFGTIEEKYIASSISNYMFSQRFAQTIRNIFDLHEREHLLLDGQIEYYGGMKTNNLRADDVYDLFFTRIFEASSTHLPLRTLIFSLLIREIEDRKSVLNVSIERSSYCADVCNFYLSVMKHELAKARYKVIEGVPAPS